MLHVYLLILVSQLVCQTSAVYLCISDPPWQCCVQLCRLTKRQRCLGPRTLQGHPRKLQRCMDTHFYIFIHVNMINHKYLTTQPALRKVYYIFKCPWLSYVPFYLFFNFFFLSNCPTHGIFQILLYFILTLLMHHKWKYIIICSYVVTMCPCIWLLVFHSCWSQCVTSCLSFIGVVSHSCSVSRYSFCQSSCGASCPSAQPETPTPPAALRPCCWAFTTW